MEENLAAIFNTLVIIIHPVHTLSKRYW